MGSRPNKGEGFRPLPNPQQQAAFIAALLAPIPKGERGVYEIEEARQVREDAKRAWCHPMRRLEAAHTRYKLAEHERFRWLHEYSSRKDRPRASILADAHSTRCADEVIRLMAAIVGMKPASRAQAQSKLDAYARFTSGVSINPKVRDAWKAAMEAELARFPKQTRKVARDA